MALQLQFNDDSQHRIDIKSFEEAIDNYDDILPVSFRINVDVKEQNNYQDLQNYLINFVSKNSISSLIIFKDNEILYQTNKYDKIQTLYLRADEAVEDSNLNLTINFQKD